MCDMLYMKLKNEKALRANLLASGVNSALTRMLLERVDREITSIEDRINGERSAESFECRNTSGFMANVLKAVYRRGSFKKRGYSPVFQVSKGKEQQIQAVTQ